MNEAEFVRLDPPPTGCFFYGTGACCHDLHVEVTSIVKTAVVPITACNKRISVEVSERRVVQPEDKHLVNCKECREMIFS